MPQYEYKVIKIPHHQQQYYCSFLACFGWQVQNIQESVDRVVNQSLGFSHTTNYGSFNARTYFPAHTNHMNTYGSTTNHGWGSQMNMEVTNIKTSLTITLFRDAAIPFRGELVDIENRFYAANKPYLERVARANAWGNDSWPERQAVNACADAGRAVLRRKPEQPRPQVAATQPQPAKNATAVADQPSLPVSIPSDPPSAIFKEMDVVHNVFQSNQSGIQIRLHFSIKNRKGIQCRICAYFFDAERNPLKDVNQRFKTMNGKVSIGSVFTPGYEETFYNNYILFMPYSELDRTDGDHELSFDVRIYDEVTKKFLATSSSAFFRYLQKGQTIRGENLPAPLPAETARSKSNVSNRPSRKIPSAPPPKISEAPKPLTQEEYQASFRKNYGWDTLTEDRKIFLEGLALDREGKRSQAQKLYKKALDLNPKESRYWQDVCRPYMEKGEFDQAIDFLRKGLVHLPEDPSLLGSIGYACVRKMDLDQAQTIADELGCLENPSAKIAQCTLLGEIAEARKNYKAAIRFYDQADSMLNPETRKIMGFNQERCRNLMKGQKKSGG